MTMDLPRLHSGKVRDLYDAGDGRLVMVASDRISTYDVVHPTGIPDKGSVLTGLSTFWFEKTAEIVPNHLFTGPQWKIHGHASREFMSGNPACVAEERAYLAEPLADRPVLREIHRRIGVDFYGIDYAVLPSGSVIFFEGNAAMRSIYPEWRDRFPETWNVTQELIRLFVYHLKSKIETHGNDSSPGAQLAPTT